MVFSDQTKVSVNEAWVSTGVSWKQVSIRINANLNEIEKKKNEL